MQTSGGATTLMYACQQCKENEVSEILKKQPNSIKVRDRTLKTPLHYCAENPNTSCAEAVLKVAPELVNAQDENGYCALHLAVIAGNKLLIKLLITKGADVNVHDNEGHSAVHWAIVSSEKEALEMIIRAGANPSTPDIHGGYPLHYAVQMCGSNFDYARKVEDTVRVVETLLNFGVDVNVKDKDGRQPILWAASAGSADAVIHLVSGGACVEAADKDGLTALHCAASRGHTTTLETLISLCGAHVDVIDGNGCSALFYSVTLGHADATELLLRLGAEPNRQDRKGRTPAHCGAAKGQLETLRILQKHGGDLWMRNVKGEIPLHEAVASGRKDLVIWLLSQNSEAINIANNDGRCPLHIASMYNNTEMVKVLLDSKALVNPVMRTSKGILMTPLNVALCKGHRSCGKYLQLHGGVPFSKVSKVEPVSGLAVKISPSDDVMMINAEMGSEHATSSQNVTSVRKSSNGTLENLEMDKASTIDKKKVYRRRKKKKSSFSPNTQGSDSDDSVHDLKVISPGKRKSDKSNEDDDNENAESEKKLKVKKVQLNTKIKKEGGSGNSSDHRKPAEKNEISETPPIAKQNKKTKTETKSLEKSKSFSETKNVSDLSPKDFPPLMQTINQLDTVIMEPDVDVSKSENVKECKAQDAPGVDLIDENSKEVKEKQEVVEKIEVELKTTSGNPVSIETESLQAVDTGERNAKELDDDSEDKKKAESTCLEKQADEANGLKSVGNEDFSEEHEKSEKSSNHERVSKKDSEIIKKTNSRSEISSSKKKTVSLKPHETVEAHLEEETKSEAEKTEPSINLETKNEDEVKENEKLKTEAEVRSSDPVKEVIAEEKTQSNPNSLTDEVSKTDSDVAFVMPEKKAEEVKNSDHEAVKLNLPQKEQDSGHVDNVNSSFEKEEAKNFSFAPSPAEREVVIKSEIAPKATDVHENVEETSADDFLSAVTPNVVIAAVKNDFSEKPNKENLTDVIEKRSTEENSEQLEEVNQLSNVEMTSDKKADAVIQRAEENDAKENNQVDVQSNESSHVESPGGSPQKVANSFAEQRHSKAAKVSRLCRRRDFKEDVNPASVTQLVQNTIRKYHMERGIFYQLLELKRYQIRSGKANEQVLVKRLADEYDRSRVFLGMKPFSGLYKFKEFEKFLYDQLKALNARRNFLIPEIRSHDDIDALSGFLKKSRYRIINETPQSETVCTCITQRCHHSACAYTSVPCSAYITDLRRHRHHKPKRECFFPRIEQPPSLKNESEKLAERPATLELIQGSEKHVITLPRNTAPKGRRYYVTFTIKGAPAFKDDDLDENSKNFLKHRHAKSV